MEVRRHKDFEKAWKKLSTGQQRRVLESLQIFLSNQDDSRLRLHQLKGKYYPQHSLSIGGNLRIHFLYESPDQVRLMIIGTHSQLYG